MRICLVYIKKTPKPKRLIRGIYLHFHFTAVKKNDGYNKNPQLEPSKAVFQCNKRSPNWQKLKIKKTAKKFKIVYYSSVVD